MQSFDFGHASEEARAALRSDTAACTARLSACKELATRMEARGIATPISPSDERLLQDLHWVLDAHEGALGAYETALSLLRQRAGLSPSDLGLLTGRLLRLHQEREPAQYEAELIARLAGRRAPDTTST